MLQKGLPWTPDEDPDHRSNLAAGQGVVTDVATTSAADVQGDQRVSLLFGLVCV